MRPSLTRRATAEGVGTGLLVAIVVGSGILAERLSPGDPGLQLLENSTATAAGLVALILAFGSVSGAHFNPLVSLADRAFGGLTSRDVLAYIPAQLVGGCAGAVVANVMFDLDPVTLSTHIRSSGGLWLGEVVATFGLVMVILGVARSGRTASAPFAVAGYIAAAYWFTSSTSFANPAVTLGRTLSDTFAGIKWSSAPAFVAAQLAGALAAVVLARFVYSDRRRPNSSSLTTMPTQPDQGAAMPSPAEPGTGRKDTVRPVEGAASGGVPVVLFLCVHNAGRSQMALGWFNHLAGGRAIARSGGSEPAKDVNPAAVAAMAEVGIDIAREFPKPWTDEIVRGADVVVAMGCGDTCPLFPGTRYEDWDLEDPAGQNVDAVRPIRDEIEGRVRALLATVDVAVSRR